MVFYTPFVGGRRFCVVDLLVLSMHESRYQVDIAENGMSILIGTEMPVFYTSSGRLEEEIPLQGDRDTLLAAHQEVVDLIISRHGSREVMSKNPQVIKLPFPCDQDISKQMIWNEGDHLLYEMFRLDPDIEQSWHQMHPILRITLKSNKKAQNRTWDQTKVISPRNPRFAGRPGTGQAGRHTGAHSGGSRGDGGGGGGGAVGAVVGVAGGGGVGVLLVNLVQEEMVGKLPGGQIYWVILSLPLFLVLVSLTLYHP